MIAQMAPITLGLGCRRGCDARELVRVVSEALAAAGRSLAEVQALCAPDWKHAEAGVIAAAAALGKPLVLLPLHALARQSPRALTHSPAVFARFGVPSIAETAALAGAEELVDAQARLNVGSSAALAADAASEAPQYARLLGPRHTTAAASCALACLSSEHAESP